MAKLIFTVAALFLLFAFSHARTPSDLVAPEIKGRDASAETTKVPVTDAETFQKTNGLLLPSERPESGSEPAALMDLDPEAAVESKLPEGVEFATVEVSEENTADASKSAHTVPLTVISFRPAGRHFHRRPFPLSFRQGSRCRHGYGSRPWSRRFHDGERKTYGDDMILSTGDDAKLDSPSFRHGGVRQIPARWVNFRDGGPRFPFRKDEEIELTERPDHHHRRHRHHDGENEGEEERHHHEHRHELENESQGEHHHHHHHHRGRVGLLGSFRKFLNRF